MTLTAIRIVAATALCLCLVAPAVLADDRPQLTDAALQFVEQLAAKDFSTVTASFDSTMTVMMPADQLGEIWNSLISQVGAFGKITGTRIETTPPYTAVLVTVAFEATSLDVRVVFDASHKVAGLYFAPAATAKPWEYPTYVNSALYATEEVSFGYDDWKLPGTLYLPKDGGPSPAVVLVHGSGPNDRDETVGPNKPFRDIAAGLAAKGIAVLAYDKRTLVHASKLVNEPNITIDLETVADARQAVEFLAQHSAVDASSIFVLGHSLGGMAAPKIAKGNSQVAGLIVLAGASRPLEDAVMDQLVYIDSIARAHGGHSGIDVDAVRRQVLLVKSAALSDTTPAGSLPLGIPPAYWLDLRSYEPDRVAAGLDIPMLFIQGGRDYQVTRHDFLLWQQRLANRDGVTFREYEALNHLMMAGEGMSTPAEYMNAGHVDGQLIEDIALWIAEH